MNIPSSSPSLQLWVPTNRFDHQVVVVATTMAPESHQNLNLTLINTRTSKNTRTIIEEGKTQANKMRAILLLLLLALCFLHLIAPSQPFNIPDYTNFTNPGSNPGAKFVMNQIDGCWRWNLNWANDRQSLADCAIGFGKDAVGGKLGEIYVVNDTSDDPTNPKPGTLRWGVIQEQPLWIVFARDMTLTFSNEMIVNSQKTIDGRGVKVEITGGPCFTLQDVTNVIIHGLNIHDCTVGKAGMVASSTTHVGQREGSDGDAIALFGSSNIWIDHCSLASCVDGLVDIIHASTSVTVSNCYFTNHDKVMLLGHDDGYAADKIMKVTVVYNYFGPGLVQRMPRIRYGYVHVANNRFKEWQMYAIGGSANPTILSQGNYFEASQNPDLREVTKRETDGGWQSWKWRSSMDHFLNGAFFVPSGYGSAAPLYNPEEGFVVMDGSMVPLLTASAGVLNCQEGSPCIDF